MEFRKGQIYKNKRNKPDSVFVILKIYTRHYKNDETALRVKGYLITGIDGMGTHLRDLDHRSLVKMFPYILFEPEFDLEYERTTK